jgi:hypothetical protein
VLRLSPFFACCFVYFGHSVVVMSAFRTSFWLSLLLLRQVACQVSDVFLSPAEYDEDHWPDPSQNPVIAAGSTFNIRWTTNYTVDLMIYQNTTLDEDYLGDWSSKHKRPLVIALAN